MPTAASVRRLGPAGLLLLALLAGCRAEEDAPPPPRPAPTPEAAVHRLLDDLRRDDLGAYAVHALPPDLYAQVDAAWRDGRSRWPLSELPLARQLPVAIDRLAAPGAEGFARRGYRQQFRGEAREVRTAVRTLGLFARQYLERSADIPSPERAHRLQQLAAVVDWAEAAPLADGARVEPLLPGLAQAARESRLAGGDAAWSRLGMHRTLTRLRPALRAAKRALAALGLDVDAALRGTHPAALHPGSARHRRGAGHGAAAGRLVPRRQPAPCAGVACPAPAGRGGGPARSA
jgi:hypothetical protein